MQTDRRMGKDKGFVAFYLSLSNTSEAVPLTYLPTRMGILSLVAGDIQTALLQTKEKKD